MLLTLSTTRAPAGDLGYLLAKHPDKVQTFPLAHGEAHVYYPEFSDARATVALLLELDPVGLVRGRPGGDGEGTVAQYVNDRPYVASSFLSVALAQVFGSALRGQCRERPELVSTPLPLEISLSALPSRGGEVQLRKLFEPLGYTVDAEALPLDDTQPDWGRSRYYRVRLRRELTLSAALAHLYVLLPVLDDDKHYWVGQDELEKLLAHGGAWLAQHPERELIALRYLKHRRSLARQALERLEADEGPDVEVVETAQASAEDSLEAPLSLDQQRVAAVLEEVMALEPRTVIDLGAGQGKLVQRLLGQRSLEKVVAVDVSPRVLEVLEDRLDLERLSPRKRARVEVIQGSVTYRDARFQGFDVACLVEVIEHVDPSRLDAVADVIFGHARPGHVVLTTPNVEHNVRFAGLAAGKLRHGDHRFEWTRAELAAWVDAVCARHGYTARYRGVGVEDPEVGPPTQLVVLSRAEGSR